MVQVFVVNPKGGCGKTTIATHLAGYSSLHQKPTLLVDHDRQKSCSDWLTSRSSTLSGTSIQGSQSSTTVNHKLYSVIIHDMPAAFSDDSITKLIQSGDKVLIPVLPSPTDIRACLRFIMALQRSGLMEKEIDIGFVANRAKVNTYFSGVLSEFLNRGDIPLLTTLRDSQNYPKAMLYGKTIFDLPEYMVKKDIVQWQPLLTWALPELTEEMTH